MQKPQVVAKPVKNKAHMESVQSLESKVSEADTAKIAVDDDGIIVTANEKAAQLVKSEKEDYIGRKAIENLDISHQKQKELLEESLNSNRPDDTWTIVRDDGEKIECEVNPNLVIENNEKYIVCEIEKTGPIEMQPPCREIDSKKVREITQNTRIETPSGNLPLNVVISDMAKTLSTLEQTRKAGYTLYRSIDDRLEEEQCVENNNDTCMVLREAREMAQRIFTQLENCEDNSNE